MPTTWPLALIRGPPELPLFRAALVWIRGMELWPSSCISRFMEETMPLVKVPLMSTSRGVPMAYTVSPTSRVSESRNSAVGKFSPSIFSTARSCPASLAMNLAS